MRSPARLEALYAELPTIECAGRCTESCGPIAMTQLEWERMRAAQPLRRKPSLMALLSANTYKGTRDALTCPMLQNGRCTVYEVRPAVCRLWGLVEGMPCIYGCKPSRLMSDAEGFEFLKRVEAVGGGPEVNVIA